MRLGNAPIPLPPGELGLIPDVICHIIKGAGRLPCIAMPYPLAKEHANVRDL